MAKANITQEFCNGLLNEQRSQLEKFTDIKLPGFQVRVTPKNKISFYACARLAGSQRRLDRKVGDLGKITLSEARKTARRYIVMMENGEDPYKERIEEGRKKSLNVVANEFLCTYVEKKVKPRTAEEYRRHIKKEILPRFGKIMVADIELRHLRKIHNELSDHPVKANRILATFSKLLNWAETEQYRDVNSNPTKLVKKYKEEKRVRRLSLDETKRLNVGLNKYKAVNVYFVALIKIILLTGARRDEIRTLKWEYINFQHKQLELPDSKTGKKVLPLGDVAIDILGSLPRQFDNEYVFCGHSVGRPMVNVRKPWLELIKLSGIEHVTLHDLRRTYASALLEQEVHLTVISNMLGHKSTKTTERYLGVSQTSMRKASNLAEILIN
ncbi:MAG: tyrosine-type recombinase/integrase [Litorimonas sp.]